MGKKKKKKKESISILEEIDSSLDDSYTSIMQEIQDYQMELYIADKKQREKLKKKLEKDPYYFDTSSAKAKARRKTLARMEGNNFFDRVEKVLEDLCPVVVIIGRLICSLILSILSIDVVKMNVSTDTLKKMQHVYQVASGLGR